VAHDAGVVEAFEKARRTKAAAFTGVPRRTDRQRAASHRRAGEHLDRVGVR
jgi:hypothetical protein